VQGLHPLARLHLVQRAQAKRHHSHLDPAAEEMRIDHRAISELEKVAKALLLFEASQDIPA
jgi:hypothetical protein